MIKLSLGVAVLAHLAATYAQAGALEQKRLEKGVAAFAEGRYDEALLILDEVVDSPNTTQEQKVKALKHQAFSLFLLDVKEEAKVVWRKLLAIHPAYELSRVDDSPVFIEFFRDVEAPPQEIIVAATPAAPAAAIAEETAVTTTLEAPVTRGCGTYLCLVPFGVGQFFNQKPAKGTAFLIAQVALWGANVGLHRARLAAYNKDPVGFDQDVDRRNAAIESVLFGLALTATVGGIVDAYLFP